MYHNVDKTGTVESFAQLLHEAVADEETRSILILACDANEFAPEQVDHLLQEVDSPVLGGIFPAIIFRDEKLDQGTIVVGLTEKLEIHTISHLSDEMADYESSIEEKIGAPGNYKTMFVLVDGLASRISALIDGLFLLYGVEFNYIGGGAGSLSFEQKPCLFTNQGLIQDSAILGLSRHTSGIGVKHGWQEISGPHWVTGVEKNVIKTLDWQPAFDVYREAVEDLSGQIFTDDNFFNIAKGYPFGIVKANSECIVRDPIARTDNGELVCVGEVPQGAFVNILSGSKKSLIGAARKALEESKKTFSTSHSPQLALFCDCISRVLYLEEDFSRELKAACEPEIPLVGALTLGEIANNGQDYLEFYNKTAVIGVLT